MWITYFAMLLRRTGSERWESAHTKKQILKSQQDDCNVADSFVSSFSTFHLRRQSVAKWEHISHKRHFHSKFNINSEPHWRPSIRVSIQPFGTSFSIQHFSFHFGRSLFINEKSEFRSILWIINEKTAFESRTKRYWMASNFKVNFHNENDTKIIKSYTTISVAIWSDAKQSDKLYWNVHET